MFLSHFAKALDAKGRPSPLTHAATFVGQGDKVWIRAADAFAARLESARARVRDLRADLARAM